ncbi:MAG: AAA family ATPase [Tepidisphaerales bacterium]
MNRFYDELRLLALAEAAAVQIVSHEWERVRGLLAGLSRDLNVPARVWSLSQGEQLLLRDASVRPCSDSVQTDPLEVLKAHCETREPRVLLMEDGHHFYLSSDRRHEVARWLREAARLRGQPKKLLVLSGPVPGLPPEVIKEIPVLDLPLPDFTDLKHVCLEVAENRQVECDPVEPLIEAARGLTVMEARLAFGRAAVEKGRLGPEAIPLVAQEKSRVIKQSGVLEYFEPNATMRDVGGLDNLKTWLRQRGRGFGAGAREHGLEPPRGIVLLGIQGCGKSLIAKSIAAEWQFPLLRFDLGRVFGGIVGQSEGNMRLALQVAEALAPCVLWIDEIEKGLSGMGSSDQLDAGVSSRVGGTLLTWMQEKTAPVFVVATANRIEALPPELLRKGRFDEIFFVDLPSADARKEILAIHLRRKKRSPEQFDLERLARESLGFSGAELEEAVREALFASFAEGREVRDTDILTAIRATYPLSRTMRDQIIALREWARARARRASSQEPETLPKDPAGAVPLLRQEQRNPFVPPNPTATG